MPLYDYRCEGGHRYEKREPFGSPAHQPCDRCGKPAHRVLNVPPIVFKGSGWYITDSKRSLRSGVGEDRDDTGGSDDGAESAGSGDETPVAKPASKAAAKKTAATESSAAAGGADGAKPAGSKPAAKSSTSRSRSAKAAASDS